MATFLAIFNFLLTLIIFFQPTNSRKTQSNPHQPLELSQPYIIDLQRQIILTKQIIGLYTERLQVLEQIYRKKYYTQTSQNYLNFNGSTDATKEYSKKINQKKHNPQHVINQQMYQKLRSNQVHNSSSVLKQEIEICPPFLIDKNYKKVFLLNREIKSGTKDFYDFSNNSKGLAFYECELNRQFQKHYLTLYLQLFDGKLKKVQLSIRVTQRINEQEFIRENKTQTNEDNEINIETEQITSYQFNPQLYKAEKIKWHFSLEYDHTIIGIKGKQIWFKDKNQKVVSKLEFNSKVIQFYSINQFKIFFATEYSFGIVNVRAKKIIQQKLITHYLGNRTKINKKPSNHQENNHEAQIILKDTQFWITDPALYNQFQYVTIISCTRNGGAIHLMLSNGDVLLYVNQKIISYVNLLPELNNLFKVPSYIKNEIKFQLTFSYPFVFVTSNRHGKFAIWNITDSHVPLSPNLQYWCEIQIDKSNISKYSEYFFHFYDYHSSKYHGQSLYKLYFYNVKQLSSAQEDSEQYTFSPVNQYRLLIQKGTETTYGKNSYKWNVFILCIIALGVYIFRKYKKHQKSTNQLKQQSYTDDFLKKRNKSSDVKKFNKIGGRGSKFQHIQPNQGANIKQTPQMDKVINELQSHLQKQGENLSREQISQLLEDMAEQELLQSKKTKGPKKLVREQNTQSEKEERHPQRGKVKDKIG